MGKFVEILAMTLGGISLFAVCFLGFAITSGKALDEVPLIGPLLMEDTPEMDPDADLTPAERIPTSMRPETDILQHTSGVLQTFSVQSPYSQSELKELADTLKETRMKLDRRILDVESESESLALRNEGLNDREERLETFKQQLEARARELTLREAEVKNEERIASEKEQLVYVNKANSLSQLQPAEAVTRLATYQVEEIARILHAMKTEPADMIVKALPQERWEEVVDRLARMRAEFPKEL